MHKCTLVIGDVDVQMAPLTAEDGWCDWWGIGGRYTGRLMLKPGAEGKVYGDAIPPAEAMFNRMISDALPQGTVSRPVEASGDGVDQARLHDLEDIDVFPMAVVSGGVVHEPDDVDLEAWGDEDAGRRWLERMRVLLSSADPEDVVTVVDVHW